MYWTFNSYEHALLSEIESIKYKYRSHIAHVQSVVPTNRLLVWNVENGPEKLCRFLNKSGGTHRLIFRLQTGVNENLLVYTFETPGESNLEQQYLMDELGEFLYKGAIVNFKR